MRCAVETLASSPNLELIWASPRHIITVTNEILGKLELLGKDLAAYSLDAVKMFHRAAAASGFSP